MQILVYGAGNIGSLYAALLHESGQDVSILAKGERLARIREHGIRLENVSTGTEITARVKTVEQLSAAASYELVLVTLPCHHVLEVLPVLSVNRHTPNVMFFGNNAAGPRKMIEALGRERVLLGFPGAAALAHDRGIRYLILAAREQPTTIGELDGTASPRIKGIGNALEAAGFPISICSNMDAWLKTHAAEIGPTANALYMAAGDPHRLARTRDALVLMLRAIREGYRVLGEHGIPVTPARHKSFEWLPEPVLLAVIRRRVASKTTAIKIGHAVEARDEIKLIAGEFRSLAVKASVPVPAIDRLSQYLDPAVEPVGDGSAEIPVNWNVAWIGLAVFAVLLLLLLRRCL